GGGVLDGPIGGGNLVLNQPTFGTHAPHLSGYDPLTHVAGAGNMAFSGFAPGLISPDGAHYVGLSLRGPAAARAVLPAGGGAGAGGLGGVWGGGAGGRPRRSSAAATCARRPGRSAPGCRSRPSPPGRCHTRTSSPHHQAPPRGRHRARTRQPARRSCPG